MTDQTFHLRLKCGYDTPDNNPANLVVEVNADDKWEPFNPEIETPGFLLFVYALFSCQLRYLRMNCAERNIVLESTAGELRLTAGLDWNVKTVLITFRSSLKSGQPAVDDIDYVRERMRHCPVSTNLPDSVDTNNDVYFE